MAPSDKTCILSTLTYLANLAHSHHCQFSRYASSLINAVVMLGLFHTLMNILGAIEMLIEGSAFEKYLQEVYSDNVINHIFTLRLLSAGVRI